MAGHNKWSQIKRQKGANDAAKSSLWGKLSRRITVEAKKANGDPLAANLRAIIETARSANTTKDSIDRSVAKGAAADAATLEQVVYESYGPGGAAIIIDALTDNRNRTVQELKHLLSQNGLELAAQGSAMWAFEKTNEGYIPQTTVPLSEADSAALMAILEAVDNHEDVQEVYTNAA